MRTSFVRCRIEGGYLRSFEDRLSGRSYLAPGQPAPLLSIRVDGELLQPDSMERRGPVITLYYDRAGARVGIRAQARAVHFTFEVVSVASERRVELVVWGPYPTTIGEHVGDTVGVVRDGAFAMGIQALNPKTLGGFPVTEDDITPSGTSRRPGADAGSGLFDQGSYADISPDLRDEEIVRGYAAQATAFGSVLQAYCRNRDVERVIPNWRYRAYTVPAFEDGGVIGSRIALFGCPAEQALDTIGAIETAEGLPHPVINGKWAKQAYEATASCLVIDFGEDTIRRALRLVRRAGLSFLYHSAPFAAWGHFELKPELFPHGWDGFRSCVDEAARNGVGVGFHTLSNFITTNDSYVTPIPDRRLARIGSAALTDAVDAEQTEIPIDDPLFFREDTTLNTVALEEELVQYERISDTAPCRLSGCTRGAWGTVASAHARGAAVGKLTDHDYGVFLGDASLSTEVAERIADFCMHTGAAQLSFDGLEGNFATGLGQYGRTLFTMAWHDRLDSRLQGRIINDASNPGHFNWHVYTRMNWGEPWHAGFRESQTRYRVKNQDYYRRNLMPRMLGWFALREETSIEDAEWLLARAAGFDAGFALAMSVGSDARQQADPSSVAPGEHAASILDAVSRWESARMSGAFPEGIKQDLQNVTSEFHLESVPGVADRWHLSPVHSDKADLRLVATAGRPSIAVHGFDNPHREQRLSFILEIRGETTVSEVTIGISGKEPVRLDRNLAPGDVVRFDGLTDVAVHSHGRRESARQHIDPARLVVRNGRQDLEIGAVVTGRAADIHVELRTAGEPLRLQGRT